VHERFESNAFAREIVRVFLRIGNFVSRLVPSYIKQKIAKRFDSNSFTNKESGVSFDLVRGAVILFVSSALIAFGTSNKLPLSTTYVTFMVAMGASMADGAWDRESAVYRVTGVISIIGAWFFTAFSAFIAALLIAVFIFKTWWIGIFIMIGLALFLLIKSHLLHKSLSSEDANLQHAISTNLNDSESFYESSSNTIVSILIATLKSFEETIEWIDQEKRKKLKDTLKNVEKLNNVTKKLKKRIPVLFKELNEDMLENGPYYAEIIDYTREAMHCLEHITAPAFKHVDNNHKPLTGLQIDSLKEISTDLTKYFNIIIKDITESDFRNAALAVSESQQLIEKISKIKKKQLKHLKKDPGSTRTNILYLDIVNESRNMILNINNMYKSFRNFSENANHSIRNSAL
jgi:Na+/phosphate symporter